MRTKNVTVTSKNQITLPAEYVRFLKLDQNRQLKAEIVKGKIVLSVQPSLEERLAAIRKTLPPIKHALTDKELKTAIRHAVAERYRG